MAVVCASCADEKRVVGVRGGLHNMPGAVSNLKVDRANPPTPSAGAWSHLQARFDAEHPDLRIDPNNPYRATLLDDPTRVVLLLYSPKHLVVNLRDTLEDGEWKLIQDQILSQRVKDEMRETLRDPLDALRALARNRKGILALLATMPDGDQTPGLSLRALGGNTFRLSAPGGTALEMPVHDLDMVIEGNEFRLLAVR